MYKKKSVYIHGVGVAVDLKKHRSPVALVKVKEMTGNSLDLYSSLVEVFIEKTDSQAAEKEKSIMNKDFSSLDNSAYIFKSSLASL